MALDNDGNHVGQGHIVQVMSGPHYKGERGTVRHVHRAFVFLHAPTVLENGGYFVVRSRFVRRTATTAAESKGDRNSASVEDAGIRRSRSRRFHKNRDTMIGKSVRVIGKGKYKGQIGMVVDVCQNNLIKVKLHTERNNVKIPRHRIRTMAEEKMLQRDRDNATGYFGTDTPGFGGATPGLGANTPSLGLHTPGGGNNTPGRGSTPSATPGMTPDAYQLPGTPMHASTPGLYEESGSAWDPTVTGTPGSQYPISDSPTYVHLTHTLGELTNSKSQEYHSYPFIYDQKHTHSNTSTLEHRYSPADDLMSFTPQTPHLGTSRSSAKRENISFLIHSLMEYHLNAHSNTNTKLEHQRSNTGTPSAEYTPSYPSSAPSTSTSTTNLMWYQQRGAVVQWNDRGTQMFGTVISSNSNGFCTIRPQNSRNTLDLLGRSLQPVQPRASDKKVLIISGVYAGLFADLESMEGNEAIVRIYEADSMKSGMEPMSNLTIVDTNFIEDLRRELDE